MKYKVGDRVKVLSDLSTHKRYGDDVAVTEGMARLAGKVVTISEIPYSDRYHVEEDSENWCWVDEMFEGLAEETPRKFKVGDRVLASDNIGKYHEAPGTITEVTDPKVHHEPYRIRFDEGGTLYGKAHRLIEEEPKAEPTPTPVVNVNVTVNLYENACWYCRKGGLVDLYFNGLPGICPKCGRVMNLFSPTNMFNNNKREEAPKKPKENKPLTKEELEALPNGTKVFIVWRWDMDSDSKKEPSWDESGWGVKKGANCRWSYEGCEETWQNINSYDRTFDAYLEEPERPS